MNDTIYKYLPVERITYLENELLRITQPADLNDPFECLPVPPSLLDISYVLNKKLESDIIQLSKEKIDKKKKLELKNILIRRTKGEITKIRKQLPENLKEIFYKNAVSNINSKIGILSLSRRWNSTLMWSHYSNAHKGFCIGFNANNVFFERQKTLYDAEKTFMPVKYSDFRIKIPLEKGQKIDPNVMLTKSKDWEYEEEERLMVLFKLADKKVEATPFDIYLYKIPHSLIAEVIIGANASSENILMIQEFCMNKNIRLYKSKISEEKFNMEREELILTR